MARRSVRRYSTPIPMDITSLGTVTVSGGTSAETGEAVVLSASISEKTDGAVLTWEGVGCDLYNAETGGLTGDEDHDESISLVFKTAGSYSVKAGYSDLAADNSPQYSTNHTIVVTAPVPEPPEEPAPTPELVGKLAYQAQSLQKVFSDRYRPIAVEAVAGDGTSFDVKRDSASNKEEPNEGEMDWMLKWLSFHFTGEIIDARGAGYFRLVLDSKGARVVPGGGAQPSKVTKA